MLRKSVASGGFCQEISRLPLCRAAGHAFSCTSLLWTPRIGDLRDIKPKTSRNCHQKAPQSVDAVKGSEHKADKRYNEIVKITFAVKEQP